MQLTDWRLQKWHIQAISRKSASQHDMENASNQESDDSTSKKTRRAPRRSEKKVSPETLEENSVVISGDVEEAEKSIPVVFPEDSKKVTRKRQKKATPLPCSEDVTIEKKVTKRRTRKKDTTEDQSMSVELNNLEEPISLNAIEDKTEELTLGGNDVEDITITYAWPPLVCCYGAARHAFIPSGRPANRLINHEIHESMKDKFWSPTKFVRAPGGTSSSVAIALASLGGRVEFMGKLGDDEYGQLLLYHLNVNKVQTRSIIVDKSKPTAISHMKYSRRGGLKMSCIKPCAEDSFLSSEINIDVLKEAKMFYFNSSSLLHQNMRSTTVQATKIVKKFNGVIFFDLNLPLPLWKSSVETKTFIQQAWNCADFIEVTKQELEFLCGIEPLEKFDTKDNDKSKFIHHKPEVIAPLWHDNLKVLFVTNGTSKIHYYTQKYNGWVHGAEDAPITPYTGDMSVAGDAIVAALMLMLTVQPHLATDRGYLERMIKYAATCGVSDQWLLARGLGFPPKEGMEVSSSEPDRLMFITEREYRTVGHSD